MRKQKPKIKIIVKNINYSFYDEDYRLHVFDDSINKTLYWDEYNYFKKYFKKEDRQCEYEYNDEKGYKKRKDRQLIHFIKEKLYESEPWPPNRLRTLSFNYRIPEKYYRKSF